MPTVSIEKDVLMEHLGRIYTDIEFDELCFEFGIELDEITSEREEKTKSSGSSLSKKEMESYSNTIIYKIDVPANRYDLLCLEGLCRAIKIFLQDIDAPTYTIVQPISSPSALTTMTVYKNNTDTIRPYVVCAILRNITLNEIRYQSFLDLQDQLHRNLCRQRTLVAIGTHDLDTISGPFYYNAIKPIDINFIPLVPNDRGNINAKELLELYEIDNECKHLKPYVSIIKDSILYPVIMDSNETILSLPPIINSNHSKITLNTKNVFIECTATDLTKANIVLDTMVTMFCEYCEIPFTVESVIVNYVSDKDNDQKIIDTYTTPLLSTRTERTTVEFCNSLIGISITPNDMKQLCNKVQLGPATLYENDTILEVIVPPTRSDILHAVDIAEDIGIAYGYNNIQKRIPVTSTVGGEYPLNQITDLLRDEISRAGYIEVLTHGLCSYLDNFTSLRRPITAACTLLNPANIEYQIVRTCLLPGLLKTLQHNKSYSFTSGFKLFEINDIVIPDNEYIMTETIVGAKNIRHICAIYAGPTSGFEIIHGLVDRIMTLLEIAPLPSYIANSLNKQQDEEKFRVARADWFYNILPIQNDTEHPDANTYFPGRSAMILVHKPNSAEPIIIGTFGIIHPEVLSNFDISYPASCVEFDLEVLM